MTSTEVAAMSVIAAADQASAPPAGVTTTTTSQTAFNITEIRREILHHLPRSDLARFIRVQKDCMEDVIRELYRSMTLEQAEVIRSSDPSRQQMYIQAIVDIDARSMIISDSMLELSGWGKQFRRESRIIDGYRPRTFNFIVPYLRQRYPGLRRIQIGTKPSRPPRRNELSDWAIVSFDTALEADSLTGPDSYDADGYLGELGGHIVCYWVERRLELHAAVPTIPDVPLDFEVAPKGKYTIQHRFDLSVHGDRHQPISDEIQQKWLGLLKEGAGFENVYTDIQIGHLDIPLESITRLYQRQIDAGHAERLRTISARSLLPWAVDEFASFAKVATTLVSLNISGAGSSNYRPIMSFRDLPTFVSLVRAHLPHLTSLTLDIDGIRDAEVVCGEQLSAESIVSGGTIQSLHIGTGSLVPRCDQGWRYAGPGPLFNAIRILSAICSADTQICIGGQRFKEDQTAYLQYLLRYVLPAVATNNRQPHHCQSHLSTAGFPALGITTLRQVLYLDYDANGRPFRQTQRREAEKAKTTKWLDDFAAISHDMHAIGVKNEQCEEAFEALNEISALACARERKMRAEQLLEIMGPLKARFEALSRSLDVDAVRRYIEGLEL